MNEEMKPSLKIKKLEEQVKLLNYLNNLKPFEPTRWYKFCAIVELLEKQRFIITVIIAIVIICILNQQTSDTPVHHSISDSMEILIAHKAACALLVLSFLVLVIHQKTKKYQFIANTTKFIQKSAFSFILLLGAVFLIANSLEDFLIASKIINLQDIEGIDIPLILVISFSCALFISYPASITIQGFMGTDDGKWGLYKTPQDLLFWSLMLVLFDMIIQSWLILYTPENLLRAYTMENIDIIKKFSSAKMHSFMLGLSFIFYSLSLLISQYYVDKAYSIANPKKEF